MRLSHSIYCFLGLAILCAAPRALADTVTLKDGSVIEGEVLSQSDEVVVIQTKTIKLQLPAKRVESIKIDTAADSHLEMVENLKREGKLVEAYNELAFFLKHHPDEENVRAALEQTGKEIVERFEQTNRRFMLRKDYEKLIEALGEYVTDRDPPTPSSELLRDRLLEYQRLLAEERYQAKQWESARDLYLAVHKAHPELVEVRRRLAEIYFTFLEDLPSAEPLLKSLCEGDSATEDDLYMLYFCQLRLGKFDESLKTLDRVKERSGENREDLWRRIRPVLLKLKEDFLRKNQLDRARQCYAIWFDSFEDPDKKLLERAREEFAKLGMNGRVAKIQEKQEKNRKVESLLKMFGPDDENKPEPKKEEPVTDEVLRARKGYVHTDDLTQAMRMSKGTAKLILVYFDGISASDSRLFHNTHLKDEAFRERLGYRFILLNVNIHTHEGRNLAEHFGVLKGPQFIVMDDGGKNYAELEFNADPKALLDALYLRRRVQTELQRRFPTAPVN